MKHGPAKQMMIGAANHIASQRGMEAKSFYQGSIVPEIKTIPAYEATLDEAVLKLLENGTEDGIILNLEDAKKNNCIIKEYCSNGIENVKTHNLVIRKAFFKIVKGKVSLKLFLRFGSVTVKSYETIITKQVVINDNLGDFIKSIQKSLGKIEKIIA